MVKYRFDSERFIADVNNYLRLDGRGAAAEMVRTLGISKQTWHSVRLGRCGKLTVIYSIAHYHGLDLDVYMIVRNRL